MDTKNTPAVFSLVYLSACNATLLAADDEQRREALTAVQTAEGARSKQTGVNGVLLVAEGYFIGWMEGDEAVVTARAASLKRSFFHTDIQVIYSGSGPARLDRWTMCLVTRTDPQSTLAKQIATLQNGTLPKTRRSVPAAMLRSIMEPEPLRRAHSLTRIGLIGQTGVWSSALISHLSGAWGMPVLHTRIHSGAGFVREAVIDYLNAEHPTVGYLRLVNVAGDVASLTWMRGIEEKLSACVLFYSVSDPEAATPFTGICLHHLESYSRNMPVLCLFGRSAMALMDPVQDLFAAKAREVTVRPLSLADSSAVWRAIESSLSAGQSGASIYGAWSATSLFPNASTAPIEPPKPLLEFSFTETVQTANASVVEKNTVLRDKHPETGLSQTLDAQKSLSVSSDVDIDRPGRVAAVPAVAPASLSLAGQQLLTGLLEIDAVVAVGAQCGQNNVAAVLIGHAPGLNAADAESAERGFRTRLNEETRNHHALSKLHPASNKQNQKILTRWNGHFTLSFDIRGSELAVVLMQMAAGYNNESLVRSAVRACLNELSEPIFERL